MIEGILQKYVNVTLHENQISSFSIPIGAKEIYEIKRNFAYHPNNGSVEKKIVLFFL